MLRFLAAREAGMHTPKALEKAECTRRVFSIELSKYFDVQRIHDAAVNALDIDPVEDRYLLSGASNGTIVIHDLHCTSGVPAFTHPDVGHVGRGNKNRHKFSIETVQWYPLDTGMFVSSGMDKLMKIWDANTLQTADEFEFSGGVYSHHLSPIAVQHSLIAVASTSTRVRLVDLKSGSATHALRGHKQAVLSVRWSPRDEFLLATAGLDSTVMLWDIRSAKGALMVLDQHNNDTSAGPNSINTAHDGAVNTVHFAPDGLHLLTFGTDHLLRLWETSSGRNTQVNYGRVQNECRKAIKVAMCTRSRPEVIFVPDDSDISVFELFAGTKVMTLRGHYSQVNGCMFRDSSQEVYSCGSDRSVLVWSPHLETVQSYEEHLQRGTEDSTRATSGFVRPIRAADAWSSEED